MKSLKILALSMAMSLFLLQSVQAFSPPLDIEEGKSGVRQEMVNRSLIALVVIVVAGVGFIVVRKGKEKGK